MKHIPDYLLPKGEIETSYTGHVPFKNPRHHRKRKMTASQKRSANPLKSFKRRNASTGQGGNDRDI
jgi:hypothetical protein